MRNWLLPEYIEDVLPAEAAQKKALEAIAVQSALAKQAVTADSPALLHSPSAAKY